MPSLAQYSLPIGGTVVSLASSKSKDCLTIGSSLFWEGSEDVVFAKGTILINDLKSVDDVDVDTVACGGGGTNAGLGMRSV